MRHPWSIRLLRACLALWFTLSGGELGIVHACPMHDGAHVASPATAGQHAGGAHGGHATRHEDTAPRDAAHDCTCIGACSVSAGMVALAHPPAFHATLVLRANDGPLPERRVVRLARVAHALPFGNGPPARVLTA